MKIYWLFISLETWWISNWYKIFASVYYPAQGIKCKEIGICWEESSSVHFIRERLWKTGTPNNNFTYADLHINELWPFNCIKWVSEWKQLKTQKDASQLVGSTVKEDTRQANKASFRSMFSGDGNTKLAMCISEPSLDFKFSSWKQTKVIF